MKGDQKSYGSLWQRFLQWLKDEEKDKEKDESERLRFDLPKSHGDTDILLSQKEKAKLQEAVDTAFYSRESSPYTRGGGTTRFRKGNGKDVII